MSELIKKFTSSISKLGDPSYDKKEEMTIRVMNNPLIDIVSELRVGGMDNRTFYRKISRWVHSKKEHSKRFEILDESTEKIRILDYLHSYPGSYKYTTEPMAVYNIIFDFKENSLQIAARVEPNQTFWILACRDWIAECLLESEVISDKRRLRILYDGEELRSYVRNQRRGALFFIIGFHVLFTVLGLSKFPEGLISSNLVALFFDGFCLLVLFYKTYRYDDLLHLDKGHSKSG